MIGEGPRGCHASAHAAGIGDSVPRGQRGIAPPTERMRGMPNGAPSGAPFVSRADASYFLLSALSISLIFKNSRIATSVTINVEIARPFLRK